MELLFTWSDTMPRTNHIRGEEHHAAKLTADEVRTARHLYDAGEATQADLADHFGVSEVTMLKVLSHKTWKNLGAER